MLSLNYRFADFTFRTDEELLYKAGELVKLRIRTAQVLRVLVESQGRIIRKEEFFDKVWRDACVEDNNLTVAVAQLRKALGEKEDCKFIETVPRKGYRFVAPVEKVFDEDAGSEVEQAETIVEEPATAIIFSERLAEPPGVIGQSNPSISARLASRRVLVFVALALILFSVAALWRRSASVEPVEPLRAVAVIPFSIDTVSRDNRLYAEKLTQDLTHNLGRISDVRMSAYDAVTGFDASDVELAKAKDDLKIDAAITGRIRKDKDGINLDIELKDLRGGASIWGKRYSFGEGDLPAAHRRIAHDLAPQLGDRRPSGDAQATTSYEAYRAYLDARHSSIKRSPRDHEKTIEEFTRATIEDESFADAHAGLAVAHIHHGLHLYAGQGLVAFRQSFHSAHERARRALQLNGACDEALTALAFVNHRYEYDWINAENNFRRAIEINPNNVLARRWYGEFLHTAGRFDEGFAEQKTALSIEPNSARVLNEMAWGSYLAGRSDEAVGYVKAANAIDRTYAAALYNASEIYESKGDYEAAVVAWKAAMTLEDANRKRIAGIEDSFRKQGREGFVRAKIAWLESLLERDNSYPTDLAKSYAALGDKGKAVEWLQKSVAARVPDVSSIKYAPAFIALRGDTRFQALVKQVNYPQ